VADVALAVALYGCDIVEGAIGWRDVRHLEHAVREAVPTLPDAARAVAEALLDRRRRVDSVGTWTADD